MKTKMLVSLIALLVFVSGLTQAAPLGTAFTYQGRLTDGGLPAYGTYDLKFTLYTSATSGSPVGAPITHPTVAVSEGVFTVVLDYGGGIFSGAERWLEVGVRPSGSSDPYVTLAPRQVLTASPNALYAPLAGGAASLLGILPDAQLSTNVALLSSSPVFRGGVTAGGELQGAGLNVNGPLRASSELGLVLDAADRPLVTRGHNAFTSGTYADAGRWGLFMENASLTLGIPPMPYVTRVQVAAYNADSTIAARLFEVNSDGEAVVDPEAKNDAKLVPGLIFSNGSGEGIASKRTPGGNQWGLDFYTGFENRMTVLHNGNVGIGITNPVTRLEVNGTVRATSFAGDGTGLTGTIPDARLSTNVAFLSGSATFCGTVGFNPASGAPFAVGNTNKVTNLNVDLLDGLDSTALWKVGGNSGVPGGMNFLGTTDNQPLEFRVNGQRALSLSPTTNSPNLILGYGGNYVDSAAYGSVILGGGGTVFLVTNFVTGSNSIYANYAVIAGGSDNTIYSNADFSTIGGGYRNVIDLGAYRSTISGGDFNSIAAATSHSTISGGGDNQVQGNATFAAIGGGENNVVRSNAIYATVSGGYRNEAGGSYSFAAGRQAKALASGSFVWADATSSDFLSTNANQFAVRASGGVRFETAGAGLTVDGVRISGSNSIVPLPADWVYSTNIVAGEVKTDNLANYSITTLKLADNAVTTGQLATNAVTTERLLNSAVTTAKLAYQAVTTDKMQDGAVTSAKLASNTVQAVNVDPATFSTTFWKVDGNADTSAATNFLGTTDSEPLELRVNKHRALRLEPHYTSPNFIAGYQSNAVVSAVGAAIGGGGWSGHENVVGADYGVIGGGWSQTVNGEQGVIAGGSQNTIQAYSTSCAIGGGDQNTIQAASTSCTIGGGDQNVIESYSTQAGIVGGISNTIQQSTWQSTIVGGLRNLIRTNAEGCVIAGGENNTLELRAWGSSISGGRQNSIQADAMGAVIGGGTSNTIASSTANATVLGGADNMAGGDCSFAGGNHARVWHSGSFVWADRQTNSFSSTATNQFLIRAACGVGINTNNPQSALHVNGTATVSVLEITGGADVAEPFELGPETAPKGAVVVIDEANPGRLKLSSEAYDTKVAGIVSGANGINPGLSLRQPGVAAGGQHVALSGRVYALADATEHPIRPGDLLTTSASPGHAMKVADPERARGAVLGKAMSGLSQGKGLVLVLVSLQ